MKHVVVIGAGIGGLASGIRLLQGGHKVTILEKEPRVGGYAIAYKRGGYSFDLALHVVPSGESGQEFSNLIELLGLENKIEFIKLKSGFEVFLGDFHFQMPNNLDQLLSELTRTFPAERNALKNFQQDLEKYVSVYEPVFSYTTSKLQSIPPFLLKLPAFLKHSKLSTKTYFEQFFQDKCLQSILFQPAAFMGISMAEFPTINFMMMFYLLMKDGMFTIKGGGQKLTDILEEQFINLGGELRLNQQVTKFICEKRKITGIISKSKEHLPCDAVIAGNNLVDVVNKLIGRKHFNLKYLRNLDRLKPSVSVLALNLGLDCPPAEVGIKHHIGMVFPHADIDSCFARQDLQITPLGFSVTANVNSDPDYSSMAGNTISIIGGTAPDKWLQMGQDDYIKCKKEVTQHIIDQAENYFPGLAEHIVVADLATPRTMYRYTGNPRGAIMGFNCTAGLHRQIIQTTRLPMKNLAIGSAWTNRLGGFMQSLKSGILAAEKFR